MRVRPNDLCGVQTDPGIRWTKIIKDPKDIDPAKSGGFCLNVPFKSANKIQDIYENQFLIITTTRCVVNREYRDYVLFQCVKDPVERLVQVPEQAIEKVIDDILEDFGTNRELPFPLHKGYLRTNWLYRAGVYALMIWNKKVIPAHKPQPTLVHSLLRPRRRTIDRLKTQPTTAVQKPKRLAIPRQRVTRRKTKPPGLPYAGPSEEFPE